MKILAMTATFGKLDRTELRLEDGLNILNLPNEGGKSTWAAFILAMLYGIDTSERAAKGTLPAKTRYKPWSGAAMEGRMELEWNGRGITIERRSKGRVPMGEFRAYETESGLPVKELTAENCGLHLLGVEKAVFERSAFLRQTGLRVDQNSALEQRLGALVTTGDETVSYSDTEKRLRDWKNAVRHNKTGELPKLERELEDTEETLRQIHALQSGAMTLRAREEEQTAELARLDRIRKGLQAAERRKQWEMLDRAKQDCQAKREKAAAAKQAAAALPGADVLQQWQTEWTAIQSERRSIPVSVLPEPKKPEIPKVFAGMRPEEIDEKVRQDVCGYDAYEKAVQPLANPVPWLAIAAAAVGIVLLLVKLGYAATGVLALATVLFAVHSRKVAADKRESANAKRAAYEILLAYGVQEREEIPRLAEESKAELARYEQEYRQLMQEQQRRQAMADAVQQKETGYLANISHALPDFGGEPVTALNAALARLQAAQQAAGEAEAAERQYARLAETIPPVDETELSADTVSGQYDAADVKWQMASAEQALRETRSRLDRCQGQISAMGDPAELEAGREQLKARMEEKKEQFEALTLAMEVLDGANDALQTQFAPEISRRAAEIMGRLTDGRYDKVMLDQSLAISARETGEVVSRDLIALSQGTGDQLYLAVRLAICGAVLPADAPLVLDDALVNFDDARAARALEVLREEAKQRQILLFTCQNREKNQLKTTEK